ncbi:PucR family transcriptional regulator [Marinicrinis lubricantis]|uniref:PucR family transcriptional regulator n=1 Tax=Marinicrinis lubricantis TaxID=2086470 RepID=A0ABW1IJP3_9BACL
MEMESKLTVQEVLRRPLFQEAYVAAGAQGLHRRVRWVHILEVSNVEHLIRGEEMILTTGISFPKNTGSLVAYVEGLVRQHASCLCIEISEQFPDIPEEMKEAADRLQFPLIVFPRQVRFVDLTQDVHSLIINRHHKLLKELESRSREFQRLTLTSQGIPKVIKRLHASTSSQIAYFPADGKPFFAPAMRIHDQYKLMEFVYTKLQESNSSEDGELQEWDYGLQKVLIQPAGALGSTWAHVVMVLDHPPEEYDVLILDSAVISIAQDLLRTRFMEERKLYTENLWVDDLLHLRMKDEERIQSLLGSEFDRLNEASHRVCLIEYEHNVTSEHEWKLAQLEADSAGVHLSMVLRASFEQQGFLPLMTLKKNGLVIVAVDVLSHRSSKEGLAQVFETLERVKKDEQLGQLVFRVGVGGSRTGLVHAHQSYQEAIHALALYPCFGRPILFFEDLGVYRLLFNLTDKQVLHQYIDSYLGPLIHYDEAKGGDLLRTLKVYLDHDGSKQLAAQKLFIVRQSLYYRLEKITELLGKEIMNSEHRLALQVALRAYQMLHPDKLADSEGACRV